jgi:hypothetical protein
MTFPRRLRNCCYAQMRVNAVDFGERPSTPPIVVENLWTSHYRHIERLFLPLRIDFAGSTFASNAFCIYIFGDSVPAISSG